MAGLSRMASGHQINEKYVISYFLRRPTYLESVRWFYGCSVGRHTVIPQSISPSSPSTYPRYTV